MQAQSVRDGKHNIINTNRNSLSFDLPKTVQTPFNIVKLTVDVRIIVYNTSYRN